MILEITSKENSHYKELIKLSKEKSEYAFVEGKKLFHELRKSPLDIEKIYIDKDSLMKFPEAENYKLVIIERELLRQAYTTESNPENEELIIAIAKKPYWAFPELLNRKKNLIFLEQIQDPGNLGTILRSSLAFEIGGVVLSRMSVDPFNPKVVRASAGAVFNIPVLYVEDVNEFIDLCIESDYRIISTSSTKAKKKLEDLKVNQPILFLFGNEGCGLSCELLMKSDEIVQIPQSSQVESLNVGVAVSIVLWEMRKKTET